MATANENTKKNKRETILISFRDTEADREVFEYIKKATAFVPKSGYLKLLVYQEMQRQKSKKEEK